jgi:hypothetical protein
MTSTHHGALPPWAFFIVFPAFYYLIMKFVTATSGWAALSEQFADNGRFQGKKRYFKSARFGITRMNGCLIAGADREGLYLRIMAPFNPGAPDLFLPWSRMTNIKRDRRFFFNTLSFEIGSPGVKIKFSDPKFIDELSLPIYPPAG